MQKSLVQPSPDQALSGGRKRKEKERKGKRREEKL